MIAGSYPSGPSSLPMPAIWRLILEDAVEAYNLPSGLLFDMLRDGAAGRAGVLTKTGLDTFIDPRREGGKMNRAAQDDLVRLVEFDGEQWLHLENIRPDVAIIRGTTADGRGNLSMEHEAAPLGTLELALAARTAGGLVIAQVKRLAAAGTLPIRAGARAGLAGRRGRGRPRPAAGDRDPLRPGARGRAPGRPRDLEPVPFGIEKVIARRAALELTRGRCRGARLRRLGAGAADPDRGRRARLR